MSKETREQKAQRLLAWGNVQSLYVGPHGACARVTGDHGIYVCSVVDSGYYNCACMYGRTHPNSQDRCSHALAVALAAQKETT